MPGCGAHRIDRVRPEPFREAVRPDVPARKPAMAFPVLGRGLPAGARNRLGTGSGVRGRSRSRAHDQPRMRSCALAACRCSRQSAAPSLS
jgi:hypothetical protein